MRRIRYEMDLRAWRNADLALHSGLHQQTVANLFARGQVDTASALAIAEAFKSTPEIEGMAELLVPYETPGNGS